MSKKISKEKSINRTKTLTELFICAVIVGTAAFVGHNWMQRAKVVTPIEKTSEETKDIEIQDTTEPVDPNKIVFTPVALDTRLKFAGDLILVNNQHEYFSTGSEKLVSIMEKNDETGRTDFTAVDYDYTIMENVYEPLAQMVDDWYKLYYNDTLIVYGSYRTNEFQKELYDQFTANTNDDDAPIVAKPGFSEHETGYAFDFSETVDYDYQGTGDFLWLNENCYKYGFVIRYAAEKKDITEYREEPWHFRYVGIPHAKYMTDNNLCFEEYIELLSKSYRYGEEHLEITDDDGASYEVFFFPSDDSSDVTNVPVPAGYKYDISGNNVDGFIVTVHKDEKTDLKDVNPFVTTPVFGDKPSDSETETSAAENSDEESESESDEAESEE